MALHQSTRPKQDESAEKGKEPSRFPLRAWLQLIRLPAVFTAPPDVLLGFWLITGGEQPAFTLPLLLALVTSVCFYVAGMIWNDVFDIEIDRRERPNRPLPAGHISFVRARTVGGACVFVALALSVSLGPTCLVVACALAAAIIFYDAKAKSFWFGPIVMGVCRALNLWIGVSAAAAHLGDGRLWNSLPQPWSQAVLLATLGHLLYVCGITTFSRQEASQSPRANLAIGLTLMLSGLLIDAVNVWLGPAADVRAVILLGLLALNLGLRAMAAIRTPNPRNVQTTVRTAVFGIVFLDAILLLAFCGPWFGAIALAFLAPAVVAGRWLYST